jgi:hypothetical protein
MESRKMTITPQLAEQWLSKQDQNRSVSTRYVEKISSDIKNGRWIFNGQPIIFNGTRLLDGQHRLLGILKAGKSVTALVVNGIDVEAMDTIDSGHARTAAHVAQINGIQQANKKIAVARKLYELVNSDQQANISNTEAIELLKKWEDDIERAVKVAHLNANKSAAIWTAPFAFARRTAPNKVDELTNMFFNEEGLENGHPMWALNRYARAGVVSTGNSSTKVRNITALKVLISIRNALQGKQMSYMGWKTGDEGEKARAFFAPKWAE